VWGWVCNVVVGCGSIDRPWWSLLHHVHGGEVESNGGGHIPSTRAYWKGTLHTLAPLGSGFVCHQKHQGHSLPNASSRVHQFPCHLHSNREVPRVHHHPQWHQDSSEVHDINVGDLFCKKLVKGSHSEKLDHDKDTQNRCRKPWHLLHGQSWWWPPCLFIGLSMVWPRRQIRWCSKRSCTEHRRTQWDATSLSLPSNWPETFLECDPECFCYPAVTAFLWWLRKWSKTLSLHASGHKNPALKMHILKRRQRNAIWTTSHNAAITWSLFSVGVAVGRSTNTSWNNFDCFPVSHPNSWMSLINHHCVPCEVSMFLPLWEGEDLWCGLLLGGNWMWELSMALPCCVHCGDSCFILAHEHQRNEPQRPSQPWVRHVFEQPRQLPNGVIQWALVRPNTGLFWCALSTESSRLVLLPAVFCLTSKQGKHEFLCRENQEGECAQLVERTKTHLAQKLGVGQRGHFCCDHFGQSASCPCLPHGLPSWDQSMTLQFVFAASTFASIVSTSWPKVKSERSDVTCPMDKAEAADTSIHSNQSALVKALCWRNKMHSHEVSNHSSVPASCSNSLAGGRQMCLVLSVRHTVATASLL